MPAALLALLAALCWGAAPADEAVRAAAERVSEAARRAAAEGSPAEGAAARAAEAASAEVARHGAAAVPELARVAGDKERPLAARVWALSQAAETRDAAAFDPLCKVLKDRAAHPQLRAAAALGIADLGVAKMARSRELCAPLYDRELPVLVLSALARGLRTLGCRHPLGLHQRLRQLGPRPSGLEREIAAALIAALGRSKAAARELGDLLSYYPQGREERLLALEALLQRGDELHGARAKLLPALRGALEDESRGPAAVPAARLLALLQDEDSIPMLLRLLDNPRCETVVAAAEALAELRHAPAASRLSALLEGLHESAAFAPGEGCRDPGAQAQRLSAALGSLKRIP